MVIKILVFIVLAIVSLPSKGIQVIVNPSVELQQLTYVQLRRVYSMRYTVWPNGTAVRVFVLPKTHQVHQQFAKKTLKMFPYQLETIWDKLTYSGVGNRPTIANSEQELMEYVANTPGAIGYIDKLDQSLNIRVLTIEP